MDFPASGKIVLDKKNKFLFNRPNTDNSFSTYCPSKLRPNKNDHESNSRRERNSYPREAQKDMTHKLRHRTHLTHRQATYTLETQRYTQKKVTKMNHQDFFFKIITFSKDF